MLSSEVLITEVCKSNKMVAYLRTLFYMFSYSSKLCHKFSCFCASLHMVSNSLPLILGISMYECQQIHVHLLLLLNFKKEAVKSFLLCRKLSFNEVEK